MKPAFRRAAPVLRDGHRIDLMAGGDPLFAAMVQAMDDARDSIWLETYILDAHGGPVAVLQALERAARRGVEVRVLVDGVGSAELSPEWPARLMQAGAGWQVYSPLGTWGLLLPSRWRRLHRKLCVVDGQVAFCGGINLLDDRHDPNHGALDQPRFDFSVRVTGPLVDDALRAMTQLWWRVKAADSARGRDLKAALGHAQRALRSVPTATASSASPADAPVRAALVLRDNLRWRRRIEGAYLTAIAAARHEIIIANAYFLPGVRMQRALVRAARRGVRVRLLLQGRYEYFMQYHGSRPVMASLLKAGVEVHEYATSFLHAKVAVIDAQGPLPWATVGSSNLDPLSLLLAREANVVTDDDRFAQALRLRLVEAMDQEGRVVDQSVLEQRSTLARALDWLAWGLMRLSLLLLGKRY